MQERKKIKAFKMSFLLRMLSNLCLELKVFFYNLNFFQNTEIINNRHKIRNQYIATRIFLVSFVSILFICFLYLLLTRITINVTTKSPTKSLFEELNNNYNDTLKCPCSNLSIPYRTFIAIQPTYHPICSVNLEDIIENLFKYTESLSNNADFRFTAALQFRLLTLLCSSVDEIITAHVIDFNATLFTNVFLLEESNLREKVQELFDEFTHIVINHFRNSLEMIRINTFGSQVRLNINVLYSCKLNEFFKAYFKCSHKL